MVIISPPFTSFIMAGFLLVFLSFPLMLIEASAIRNFQPPWWYTKGPVVMRRRYFLPTPSPLREVLVEKGSVPYSPANDPKETVSEIWE